MRIMLLLGFALLPCVAFAEDLSEAARLRLPPVCTVLGAPLTTDGQGPLAGGAPRSEDAESLRQSTLIQAALEDCPRGHAVRLSLGSEPSRHAFLIDPIQLPAHRSLIIDGGVTVFASRNPANFQIPDANQPKPGGIVCGQVGEQYPVTGGCYPLITLAADTGVYGFGIIDGQGHRALIRHGAFSDSAWWDLLVAKASPNCRGDGTRTGDQKAKGGCSQASPIMISTPVLPSAAGKPVEVPRAIVLHGVTVRNPPYHTIRLNADDVIVRNVKVQAPWNVPNSDGFDIGGTNILLTDITVANGDQNVAVTSTQDRFTSRVRIERATFYGKGGVAMLSNGVGVRDLVVRDMAMTGSLPSFAKTPQPGGEPRVLINGRDPMTMSLPGLERPLRSFRQAIPGAVDSTAMQISLTSGGRKPGAPGPIFEDILFDGVCLQDIVNPIRFMPLSAFPPDQVPVVKDVIFKDVHALTPSEQFVGIPYKITLQGNPTATPPFRAHLTFQNVVFADRRDGSPSLDDLAVVGNVLRTKENVYPRMLNRLSRAGWPKGWKVSENHYARRTDVSDPSLAIRCRADRWPFLTGEVYISGPSPSQQMDPAIGSTTVSAGSGVTLSAILQPAMSQTTWFFRNGYSRRPGLLAIGTPALTRQVHFYDGDVLMGAASLGANGTLATFTVRGISPGTHTFIARYPGDRFYKPYSLGSVTVTAR